MASISASEAELLKNVHPELRKIAIKIKDDAERQGLKMKYTQGLRTKEYQNDLYNQGRTKPGKIVTNVKYPDSYHCWGIALDFCQNIPGKAYDDSTGFFTKIGSIAKKYGLVWGGDWKDFKDRPHIETHKFGTMRDLKKKYREPSAFMKTWVERDDDEVNVVSREFKNGDTDKVKSIPTILHENQSYVNIRSIAELLNLKVVYDSATKMTKLEDSTIEDGVIIVDGKDVKVKKKLYKGSNLAEIRPLIENMDGYEIAYNNETRMVSIDKKGK